ncbi:MAG: transposase [Chitinophagaceae bacterium]|nr:transposase [Rubrivivax sp.]
MDTNEDAKSRARRRHDGELKRQVLAECAVPGASVAKVAMAHGLNANLVHKWRRELRSPRQAAATFVPVAMAAPAVVNEPPQHIELELHRGTLSVRVRWPMAGTGGCAAWLREILR